MRSASTGAVKELNIPPLPTPTPGMQFCSANAAAPPTNGYRDQRHAFGRWFCRFIG
jgi:hypothetical protein